jgi:glycolate dehydrogenase FAD-binding subunit
MSADTIRARDERDVEDAIRWAVANDKTLEIVGAGTKRAIGRAAQWDLTLDLSGLSGVTLYEPQELVLTARAGTPLAEIEALLAANSQQLAFEPMDYAPLLGGPAGGTIGGALAANLSGPRRIKAGAARDHFLGFQAVSGRGERFKSGGRVVKNVTGYDLCKVMAGSWGTLAALTEVTIKTLPRPETEATVAVLGLDAAAAARAMTAAMNSSSDVSSAAHLPEVLANRFPIGEVVGGGRAITALRLEGVAPSVTHRQGALQALLRIFGETRVCADLASRGLWRAIRDAAPFAASRSGPDHSVWRISTAPAKGAELARRIEVLAAADVMYDWAGGLIWAQLDPLDDAGTAIVRAAVAACGGHATLIRAPAAIRAAAAVFQPQKPALATLTKRVKESFDPKGVLNPGRMWAGV